jgi:hypothetical protein
MAIARFAARAFSRVVKSGAARKALNTAVKARNRAVINKVTSKGAGVAKGVSKAQAATNAARATARQPGTRKAIAVSRTPIRGNVTRQAKGPVKRPGSDGTSIAKNNTVTKAKRQNFHLTESLKEKAVAKTVERAKRGGSAKPLNPPRGKDYRGYMPDRGRINPAGGGIDAERAAFKARRMKETGADQLRGTAKRTAERAIDKEVTQFGKTFERDVRAKAVSFQQAQQAKALKGATAGSRAKMAADVARRPKVQGPKPPATKTTGTRTVAANPPTNSGRGVRGRVVDGRTIRKGNAPVTNKTSYGERSAFNLTESQVRQGASNPAPTRPTGLRGAQVRQPKGGNPVENFSPARRKATPHGNVDINSTTGLSTDRPKLGEGLAVKRTGQFTGSPGKGSAKTDTRQTRTNSNGKTDRLARLGQPVPRDGINTNNPVVQQRAAAAKAAEKALPKQTAKAPTPPKRTAEQEAALRRQSRSNTEASRQAAASNTKKSYQLQNDWNNKLDKLGTTPGTTKSGEVRLQGSAKGNQHMTGIESGSRDGRVPKSGPHDGTVSRQVTTKQAADADRKAIKAIKARNANNKSIDKYGNDLNALIKSIFN